MIGSGVAYTVAAGHNNTMLVYSIVQNLFPVSNWNWLHVSIVSDLFNDF